jgi:hypothetical protein
MKFYTKFFLVLTFLYGITTYAQIPNSGFENWIDELTPQDWNTNNFPSFWTTVSRSSSPYAGSYAAKLEVANASGFPYPAVLTSTFPVNQAYQSVNGYYQFHPTGSNVVLSIYAYFFGGGLLLGNGHVDIENTATSYTQFTFDVILSDTPDSLMLQLELIGEDVSNIGSYALVDQLSLGGASAVEQISELPQNFNLTQNYPNPFNPSTKIGYSIPEASFVQLKVYDILGNEVATLVNEEQSAGTYKADFKAEHLSSGLYIARLSSDNITKSIKMTLMK